MKKTYQKRPKLACIACGLFGIGRVDVDGVPLVRPHKVNGKLCDGSGRLGFTVTDLEWVRHQANYRTSKTIACGNCAHRIPKGSPKNREFLCSVLNQAVHATNVCKHHKQSGGSNE